jgi:preprotein translocase subunit SecG
MKVKTNFLKEGILLGAVWIIISLIIDLVMFMPESPMKMSFIDYMMDIGLTYLIIPAICIGFGYLLQTQKSQNAKQ